MEAKINMQSYVRNWLEGPFCYQDCESDGVCQLYEFITDIPIKMPIPDSQKIPIGCPLLKHDYIIKAEK